MSKDKKLHTNWKPPSLSILNKSKDSYADAGDVQENAKVIQDTLAEFGVNVKMLEAHIGPKVTQFTMRVHDGVSIERISYLEANIALNLAAESLRIEIISVDESLVAVEVPNRKAAGVPLSDVVKSKEWLDASSQLSVAVGRDLSGQAVVADLAKIKHLLFVGQTGSGKSVLNNVIITSLLFRNSPDDLKLILIDPKQVEMAPYEGIPHLQFPIITEPEQWSEALDWLSVEAESRMQLFFELEVESLDEYNDKAETRLPYLVMVCDELSDMMMVNRIHVEDSVRRITSGTKNIGIHVIFSTSRPSVDIVTGMLKYFMPTRWALATASQIDSLTILDSPGAEKLLGQGDLLYRDESQGSLRRVQVALLSDEDVTSIADYCANQKSSN